MIIDISTVKSEDYAFIHQYLPRITPLRISPVRSNLWMSSMIQDQLVGAWNVEGIKTQYPVLYGNLH